MNIAVIPAYNEEKTIREVITRCKEVDVYPFVVDDGSADHTYEIARDLTDTFRIFPNQGKGFALNHAFGLIKVCCKADYIIIIDADLQFNPYEIPKLLEALKDYDYVVGQRDWSQVPLRHYLGNLVWIKTFNFLYGTHLQDTNCGFVAMKSEVMMKLKVHSGYIVDNDMLIQVIKLGYKVKNVPVSVKYYNTRGVSGIRMVIGILIFIIIQRLKR